CRVGSPCGSLTDRRSWRSTLALHPVARLGLPAPWRLLVSSEPSKGQHRRQSLQGHGSRIEPSCRFTVAVKPSLEHGLPTASCVRRKRRPPPWTTLHRGLSTTANARRVVQ